MIDDIERLRAQGHKDLTTVGEVIDGPKQPAPSARFEPARLPDTPPVPAPGIYFGMSEDEYLAIPALSNSGIKKLSASPMIFWASTPWLSEKKRLQAAGASDDKAHQIFGRAYHCRLMEGRAAFDQRFAVELTPAECPGCLESTDQIKAAIGSFTKLEPVKPAGKAKAELEQQLVALRTECDPAALNEPLPGNMDTLKLAIREYQCEQPVVPVVKVEDVLPGTGETYMRSAVKADWIAQLLELDPDAPVFAAMQAEHAASHKGKTFLTADQHMELEIAAAMVERDPEAKTAFRDGHAEVVLIWYCPTTGVPMKAKVDYLKLGEMVDLKSIANQRELSIENCIRFAIASYKYNIQPVVYFEGAEAVRGLIRKHGDSAIHSSAHGDVEWAMKWAKHQGPDEWLWIFQQKGDAPITRGVRFPRGGVVDEDTRFMVDRAKKLFLRFSEVFGTAPWLDTAPIYTISDEDVPRSATEL